MSIRVFTKNSKSKRKRRKSSSLTDVTWQFVGLITIFVLMVLVVFGNSYEGSKIPTESLLDQSFSEAVATFDRQFKSF